MEFIHEEVILAQLEGWLRVWPNGTDSSWYNYRFPDDWHYHTGNGAAALCVTTENANSNRSKVSAAATIYRYAVGWKG